MWGAAGWIEVVHFSLRGVMVTGTEGGAGSLTGSGRDLECFPASLRKLSSLEIGVTSVFGSSCGISGVIQSLLLDLGESTS